MITKPLTAVVLGLTLASPIAYAQLQDHVSDGKWTTFVRVFTQGVPDSVVLMAGDPPPQLVFGMAFGSKAALSFSRDEMLSRIGRQIGYEAITQRVEGHDISLAFRPRVLPFHLQLSQQRRQAEQDIARDMNGARPWPPEILTRRDVPGYAGLSVHLPTPHSGTLGDLAALNFSKRLDISPVLRNAIVVVQGLYREEWLMEAVAAAVGGVFRETSHSFVIDPDPRAWRRMMLGVIDRRIALAASASAVEALEISKEALLVLSDEDLRRSFSARPSDPDRLVGPVERQLEWSSPLGRRITRYLEFLDSDAFSQRDRETNRQLLAFIDRDRPMRVIFSTEGSMVAFYRRGSETGIVPMFLSG